MTDEFRKAADVEAETPIRTPTDPPREASDEQIAELLKLDHLRRHAGTFIGRAGASDEFDALAERVAVPLAREVNRLRAASVPPLPTAADAEGRAKEYVDVNYPLVGPPFNYGYDLAARDRDVANRAYLAGARDTDERHEAEIERLQVECYERCATADRLAREQERERMAVEVKEMRELLDRIADSPLKLEIVIQDRDRLAAELRQAREEVGRLRFAIEYAAQMGTERKFIQQYLVDTLANEKVAAFATAGREQETSDDPSHTRTAKVSNP